MPAGFVHLRSHTEFSLIDGLLRVKGLIKAAADNDMPAVGYADQGNLCALVKFYKGCLGSGVKPVMGADMWVKNPDDEDRPFRVTLFAINDKGYRNLTEIVSLGYNKGQHYGRPEVDKEWIKQQSEGLIVLSGARDGDIGAAILAEKMDLAGQLLQDWQSAFGDNFYLELQRTSRPGDETLVHGAVALASQYGAPVVATNDVRFMNREDFDAHEARVCIGESVTLDDPRRERRYSEEQYFKSAEEMQALFEDIPEAIENTLEIAKRCSFEIELGKYYLPEFPIPEDTTEAEFFRKISYDGLDFRLQHIFKHHPENQEERRKEYIARLEFELDIIIQMGFPGYFLIVMDFIQWGKDHDIPVGPGRGSGAGSLVAYVLLITDIDPLQYDLLFERFLNPERVSMPDFDIDFCMERREEVISYVADNYGREAVSQIITFGTMAAKAVVRDVARAQGKAYAVGDRLSKAIPFEVGINLQKAYDMEEPLRDYIAHDEDAAEVWAMAKVLEGITRQTGKHAGGVVIAPTKLTDFSATSCDDDFTGLVTQLDKSDVEEAGLVKFDFLGLKTLTVIDWAKKTIDKIRAKEGKDPLIIEDIPLDDRAAFEYLKQAKTTAVFQLESRGMKDLVTRLEPDNLEEMIALVALFRPGPLESGMVDDFINRKHGRSEVAYPHPDFQHESLKVVLEPTYGVIVYQEQVMQIAQVLAGYTLGGADMLRRAMGKKKPEEMAKQRETFREGAISVNVDPDLAMKIFDLVEKFAGYGFNKSHSAAYAVVSYHTLWLKTHYPAPFMAAVLTADMGNTDKVVIFVEECREMGLDLVLPDINQGDFGFTVNDAGQVVYGLGAIKGVGEGPIEAILEARKDGPFSDLFDFCARVDRKKINKRSLEALIRCGAFDKIGPNRAVMFLALPDAVKSAEQSSNSAAAGMWDMFGEIEAEVEEDPYKEYLSCRDLTLKERLNGERDTLGLYVTGHPFDEYEKEVRSFVRKRLVDVQPSKGAQSLAGLVVDLRMMKNKRGDNMAFVTLDDRSGRMEVAIFSDIFEQVREYLVKDIVLVAEAEVNYDEYSGSVKARCKGLRDITTARMSHSTGLRLSMKHHELDRDFHKTLRQQLEPFQPEGIAVQIAYEGPDASGVVVLGDEYRVEPNDDLMMRLKRCYGEENVQMQYDA